MTGDVCLKKTRFEAMRECLECGKGIPFRKERGHREREYCSDTCRKRAWRARQKPRQGIRRIIEEAKARIWEEAAQHVHREIWQDELEHAQRSLDSANRRLEQAQDWNDFLEGKIERLETEVFLLNERLADKEAEIARLTFLLENQAKRKHR